MLNFRRAAISLLTATALTAFAVSSPATAAPLPSAGDQTDDFHTYSGATPLADLPAGAVLKTRSLTYSLQGIPLPLKVEQILYRTTDMLGRPTANVTSVIKPPVALKPGRVIAYGSFYDSLNPLDGPSYMIAGGQSFGGAAVHVETALVTAFLLKGYSVVMADTQGATANFAAGPEYGYTTLDSLRAVLAVPKTGVPSATAKIGLLGYSGGAIATNWAATLAPIYAPDINERLVGAAEGGVLVNPASNLTYVGGSQVWAGVIGMALVGVARAQEIDLKPYLSDYGIETLNKLEKAPISEVLGRYPGLTWQKMAKPEYADPTTVQVYVDAVNQLNLGERPTPTIPMLIGQGTGGEVEGTFASTAGLGAGDGVMIAGDVRSLARQYCADGAKITYRQYALSHFSSVPLWYPEAISWLDARFSGRAAGDNCATIKEGNSLAPLTSP